MSVDASPQPCAPTPARRDEIVDLEVGPSHNCVLLGSSEIACWGANGTAQLGRTGDVPNGTPALVVGDSVLGTLGCATGLAAGTSHTCAATANVDCWGAHLGGFGYSSAADSFAIDDVQAITSGARFACALLRDSRVLCWGAAYRGQLGSTTSDETREPRFVSGLEGADQLDGATSIAAGADFACAVLRDGGVVCWGDNAWGQLGSGAPASSAQPLRVPGVTSVVDVSAGGGHACARHEDGTVTCWGRSTFGQAGVVADITPPTAAPRSMGAKVEAGGSHTCALTTTGAVLCWGYNRRGQLGDGTLIDRAEPVEVRDLGVVRELGAGTLHTCALSEDGVRCWGANNAGQVGGTGDSQIPREVAFRF